MKTIEEKNRMIAEFMGMQETKIGWYDAEENLPLEYTTDNTFDELLFNKSWDWLMPVAHKCMQSTDNLHPYAEASVVNAITRGLTSFQIHFAYDEVIRTIEFLQSKTDSHD